MKKLSIEQLLETLNKAIELNLQQDFIDLLVNELDRKRFMIN
ncbi:sporulation histidine kinase inhibitor Sda [Neobacillus drentensis]|jgi:RNA:NAD 2'-phosphotransferase (TPT1/KptA family)|nr:sporulation histidine kinase inhibitor Sda [Bacillus sp. AFS006103]